MKQAIRAATVLVGLAVVSGHAGDKEVCRVGIAKSAFRDVPKDLLWFAGQPLEDLVKAHTGLDVRVTLDSEWPAVVRDLNNGNLQLAVLQGHEYAWAKEKCPDLQPLVCSVYRPKEVLAYLLVRHDCKAASLAELKGRQLVLAATLKDHARLFLEKRQAEEMSGTGFRAVAKVDTVHEAIQKVIDGEADLTVVDHAAWNYFQQLYPGPSQNLKVLGKSEQFPPTVLVYKKGGVDEGALNKVRAGLLNAHETTRGARLMGLIRIEKFDVIPDSYEETVRTCLKAYPTPPTEK
jgi:ABC-type phosphate/phosphonate transport system substrate-binding protein